jgi:cell wall binding repeat family protein
MNKKVLLSVLAAGLVATTATPALAEGNNGGANLPGPNDSRVAYESQTEFVNADRVNEYVAAHSENINANKAKLDAAVAALKKAENAKENVSHDRAEKLKPFQDAVVAAQAAYDAEVAKVSNEAVKHFQEVYNTASKKEGKYYILNETPEQKNARYLKEHGLDKDGNKVVTDKDGNKVVVDKDGKPVLDKNGKKVVVERAQRTLPKTHAVK